MQQIRALMIVGLAALLLTGGSPSLPAFLVPASIPPASATAADEEPAAGMFLVAQRGLHDPYFGQTVVLLLQHDANGSLGLIVNRRFNMQLSDAVSDIDEAEASKHALFYGGPLGTHRIFMLMRNGDADGEAHQVTADIYFSAHRDVLEQALHRKTPDTEMRLFLGYSSWSAGQLDRELERGSWHLAAGDAKAIFDTASHSLWERLIEILEPSGIEVKLGPARDHLSSETGLPAAERFVSRRTGKEMQPW